MKIAIASDHAGFEQKQELIRYLKLIGKEVVDLGPTSDKRVDYPDYALLVSRQVVQGDVHFGILICGTGIGMAIAANKISGIRAVNAITPEFAALAREHNDANILTLSGRFVGIKTNCAIIESFFQTEFAKGRHVSRLEKIDRLQDCQK